MLKNMKIGLRLGIGFGLMFLLFISLVVFGINRMDSLSSQTALIYNHPLTVSNAVLRINANIIKIHRTMKDIALAQDNDSIEKYSRSVDLQENNILNDFEIINERFLGEKYKYISAMETFIKWKPIRDEVITLMLEGERIEAANITREKGARYVLKIEEDMEELNGFAQFKAKDFVRSAEITKTNAFHIMYLLAGLSVFVAAILSIVFTRSFTGPIGVLKSAAEKIGKGKLDTLIEIESKDEIGQLAISINSMTSDLNEITTSRDNLSMEIVQRKKAEKAIKESEEKYRILFERESDAIFIYDFDTANILDANEATLKMYGYDRDEIIGMSCLNFSAEVEQSTSAFQEIRENNEVKVQYRLHRKKDGTMMPVIINGYAFELDGEKAMFAVSKDITERVQLEKAIIEVEDKERQRIGHDLHDGLGQILAGISLKIHSLFGNPQKEGSLEREEIEKIRSLIEKSKKQVRSLIKGLLPVNRDKGGIVSALEALALNTSETFNVVCDFKNDIFSYDLDDNTATQLYRIAQEAVNNAVKHSNPGYIEIILYKHDNEIELNIVDDGIGINDKNTPKSGMGIQIMNYRANLINASFELISDSKNGTIVKCIYNDNVIAGNLHQDIYKLNA